MKQPESPEATLGYEINPDYWGNGYATEAVKAVVDFGFTQLKLHRISSWCIAENTRSAKVLTKLGMQLEGHQRENEYFKDRYWGSFIFGILEDEWRERNTF